MEDKLPNCCYDYRYDQYEDGFKIDDDYYNEMEDIIYERNNGK